MTPVEFGPALRRPVALLAAAGAFAVPELWALAVVLLAMSVRDWRCRPALAVCSDGFSYIAGLRREFASWLLVDAIRVRQERHFLAFGRTVEIDLSDETLIVLSRAQLGAEPDAVAAVLESAWQEAVRSARPF